MVIQNMSDITLDVTADEAHEIRVALTTAILSLEFHKDNVDEDEARDYEARVQVMYNLLDRIPTGIKEKG
jgi:hypothetical protein